ncbi:hypothetical protein JKF63_02971 [Porcisia hertigi]|uniref:Uncharacterized protein n=1 Tax=Porcisia hertigi TaxID=2761500 RepID=A0A836HW89_9TRYP|nr:hypothetical protein JKF63_02971 [Porcisia hertigi]
MECMTSTITVTLPSFVAVTLTPEPGFNMAGASEVLGSFSTAVKPKTLRVPLTTRMTVRELAKGAMMRYMLSLRRTAKETDDVVRQLCRRGISVTDVYILLPSDAACSAEPEECVTCSGGGADVSPVRTVELFSDDCVVQVVQVMKETVYMRFRVASSPPSKQSATLPKQTVAVAGAPCTEGERAPGPAALTFALAEKESNASVAAPPADVAVDGAACDGPGVFSRDETIRNMAAPLSVSHTVSQPAQESSSTPVITRQHSERVAHVESSGEDNGSEGEEEEDKGKAEEQNIALSIATLREREAQRIRWGPEAHKHFAANYVSSPEKIMTGRFKCSRRQPPAVQLHLSNVTFSASSPDSPYGTQSPRSLRDSGGATESSSGGESPPRSGTQKVDGDNEERSHYQHEGQESSQPPYKNHRSDTCCYPPSSTTTTTAEALAVSSTTQPSCIQATAAPPLSKDENMHLMMEDARAQCPSRSPNEHRQDALLCSVVTPAATHARADTTPSAPDTVAKPVVEVVARQLSFEEDSEFAPKRSPVFMNGLATFPPPGVLRVIQGGRQ